MQDMVAINSSISSNQCNGASSSYGSLHPSVQSTTTQCSAISEDSALGKDDLTNFVLLWEV